MKGTIMDTKKKKIGRPPKIGDCFSERIIIMMSEKQRDLLQKASDKLQVYRGTLARKILVKEAKKIING